MGYLETNDLAEATSFRNRLKIALVDVAGDVLAEDPTTTTQAASEKRVTLCNNVLRDPAAMVPAFVWPVLTNPEIASDGLDSTDEQLKDQVNTVWNTVAGVSAADLVEPTGTPAPPPIPEDLPSGPEYPPE